MKSNPFAAKGVQIADKNLLCAFVVRLDPKDYREVYKSAAWGGKVQPDSMYGLCFRYCMSMALEIGRNEYPDNLRLDFIIESGHPNRGSPNEIVNHLKRQMISGASEFLGTVTPMDKEECYGLQAADALATGFAWVEGGKSSSVPLIDISGAKRLSDVAGRSLMKAPLFRFHIDRDEIENFRDDQFALADFRKKWGQQRQKEIAEAKAASAHLSSSEGQSS